MAATSNPAACSARIAASLPEPGPFTRISTFRIPRSMASRAAASAANCAAKGVLLRDPLNPTFPAEAHETTFPKVSVKETIVLLNVALITAIPLASTGPFFLPRLLGLANSYLQIKPLLFLFLCAYLGSRPLVRPGIGAGTLTVNGQTFSMPQSPVRTNVHQALYVHINFCAERTLNLEISIDVRTNLCRFLIRQILDASIRINSCCSQYFSRSSNTNTEQVG